MKKELCIQVHPDRVTGLNMNAVRLRCEALASNPLVHRFAQSEGVDSGRYVNIMFETADITALWSLVWREIYSDVAVGLPMRLASIATCQGKQGWDDYLLLHHYDPAQKLDHLKSA
jgi:hypothetical protein